MMREEIIRLEHATKNIMGEPVLSDYRINLYNGEIVSLCGVKEHENRTLLDIFSGTMTLDEGSMFFYDKPHDIVKRPLTAWPKIVCVRKVSNLIQQLSVAENLFVIKKNARKLFLNSRSVNLQTDYILRKAGLEVRSKDLVSSCSPAEQHIIEIIRASIQNAKLVVIDDIIDSYTEKEKKTLIDNLKILRENGCCVLYLSFYPQLIADYSDRILLMNSGRHLRTYYPGDSSIDALSNEVYRQNRGISPLPSIHASGQVVFEIQAMQAPWSNTPFNMELHRGEVLGCYDNESKFSSLLLDMLSGSRKCSGVYLSGEQFCPKSLSHAARHGVVLIPEDMLRRAYLENIELSENLILPLLRRIRLAGGLISRRMRAYYEKDFHSFLKDNFEGEKIDGIYLKLCILFYRWILYRPRVIVCMEPYAYSDSLVRKIVAAFLHLATSEGIGIIVFSREYLNLRQICDRVIEI